MMQFTREVVERAGAAVVRQCRQSEFTGVVTDTRCIEPGSLFIALKGERFDGHDFLMQAVKQGATGLVISRSLTAAELKQLSVTVFEVSDTLAAYQALAREHRRRFAIPVIAITGSNGKTTTKDLTAAVLSGRFKVLKTQANFNNEIGLPLTLLQLDSSHQAAVVEMGMRGFGQIRELAAIAEPDIGIVTNVGETHMELLGSLDNIAAAKAELVESIGKTGTIILNADDLRVAAMRQKAVGRVLTFAIKDETADVWATAIRTEGNVTKFYCCLKDVEQEFILPMLGRHNVYNALAAIAAGFALGLSGEEMQQGLNGLEATKMRFECQQLKEYLVINDAYNASPMSMQAAIETLDEVAEGRKIAVLGDMLELGDVSLQAHRDVGRTLASHRVDVLVTRGEMGREIGEAAKAAGLKFVYSCDSHEAAGQTLRQLLLPGDTILFKGSRGMQMEKIIQLL